MTRTRPAPQITSIAALLASLAAGCVDGTSTPGSSGQCGTEELETYPLQASELAHLETTTSPTACMDLCRAAGSFEPTGCSWTAYPDGGSASADGSTSHADGSTSAGGSSSEGSTGSASTGDASTGDASTGDASTGDASTGDASTGGASTGDASTGDASTGDASTGDPTTTGDAPTSFGGDATFGGGTGGFDGAAGELHCTVFQECVGGRGHAALQPADRPSGADALGEWLAAMAHSEAASVVAFHAIADELEAHGAPAELIQRAREAAGDEVRHAETMGTLARRRGVEPAPPRFSSLALRELEALALENAVEGCVRETWAALEAGCQARRATDPALRRAMQGIAADESRHAQLSWDLDAWARTRLSPAAVARIDAARRQAVDALERGLSSPRPALLHASAGLPEPAVARRLVTALRHALWS